MSEALTANSTLSILDLSSNALCSELFEQHNNLFLLQLTVLETKEPKK